MLRGWCPSLFEPMPSGDGLLVRLKPPGARLTETAARQLAVAATRFGDGAIALTRRAAIQVRGLRARDVAAFAASMVEAGLADRDPEVERRRAVIPAPLMGADPGASPNAPLIAGAIEDRLARDPRLARLLAKFCVSVDGGGALPLGDVGADIQVACGGEACSVAVADFAAIGDPEETVEWAAHLARAFLDLSAHHAPAPRRMRELVEAVGARRVFASAGAFSSVIAGLDPAIQPKFHLTRTLHWMRGSSPRITAQGLGIGWIPYADAKHGAFGMGLPFGATDAACLAGLADIALRFGDGTLRLTPWRALVVPGVSAYDAAALREAGAAAGLIVDSSDPRVKVSACVGRPGCASASVNARADAAALATPGLRATVHVSGCAKGCAHPGAAVFTLVGENGRYALVRDGGTKDAPLRRGLTLAQARALIEGAAP